MTDYEKQICFSCGENCECDDTIDHLTAELAEAEQLIEDCGVSIMRMGHKLTAKTAECERLRTMVEDAFVAGFWHGVDHTEEDMSGPAAGDMVMDLWGASIQAKALAKGGSDE